MPSDERDLDVLDEMPCADVLRGPADFDEFWQDARREADTVAVDVVRLDEVDRTDAHVVTAVEFRSTDGVRVGGWLREPLGPVERGVVVLHGYGGVLGADHLPEPLAIPRTAEFHPVLRGLPAVSRLPGLEPISSEHVLHGITDRRTYIHRGCTQDVWLAITALHHLVPAAAGHTDLAGVSFGGGIGALALPWEPRIARACLHVPSFGNHPERLRIACTGSGEQVRQAAERDPSIREVLRYFDAATAATRVGIPVMVCAAQEDPAVPPVGQFSVFQALAGQKSLLVQAAAHREYPGEDRDHSVRHAAFSAWLR